MCVCVCVCVCRSACVCVCVCGCMYVSACTTLSVRSPRYVCIYVCLKTTSHFPHPLLTSAAPLLKTNTPFTLAIISPNPYAISHLTEIIKEMCNYQKKIIILEGNVTSDCKMLIPKVLFQKRLGPKKTKKQS